MIDLNNPAVVFLFFGIFSGWTLFSGWALSDTEMEWPKAVSFIVGAISGIISIAALCQVIASAL